jgi:alpha-tubulin suppressor-like RCC1 family protein
LRAAARWALLALVVVGGIGGAGCKRHKPPARVRVWLGPSHACSLQKTSLELECWGENGNGQLGDGTTLSSERPARVLVDNWFGAVTDLALGAAHTCALSEGAVHCWGNGARGQLGTGHRTTVSAPSALAMAGDVPVVGVTAVAAGGDRTCVLVAKGVRCWGEGVLDAQALEGFDGAASAVAVGPGFVCAAFSEPRAVRCSGADEKGQSAAHQPILPGAKVVSLSAGGKHACAVLDGGSVQCWGANESGQLGDGTTTDSRVPALVQGLPPAAEVRAGEAHTCARLRNSTVACWGNNDAHQLVDGTSKASSRPLPVRGIGSVVELAVGGSSACVRLIDGEVRCWGANGSGQLGDGTRIAHDVPMPVKGAYVESAGAKK